MKKITSKKRIITLLAVIAVLVIAFVFVLSNKEKEVDKQNVNPETSELNENKISGLIMLIEFEKIEGILQWEKELDSRNLTALIKVQDNVLEEYPDVFKRLATKGYEIAGGYDKAPFWDMSYDEQYEKMREAKYLVEKTSGKRMTVFGSRYFAYDENTLKAADALDIEYILGRGVNDVEAVIYSPNEYDVKVISVSNVDVGEMGRGSLCDYSLWARGSSADDFGKIFTQSVAKEPSNMILVSHAYLGGTRLEWWNEYEKALSSDSVLWKDYQTWIEDNQIVLMDNIDIPINDEVKYVSPEPEKEMEEYEAIEGIEESESGISSDEMMCQ